MLYPLHQITSCVDVGANWVGVKLTATVPEEICLMCHPDILGQQNNSTVQTNIISCTDD